MPIMYKCNKHGVLTPSERIVMVNTNEETKWCVHCYRELMDKYCATTIVYQDDLNKTKEQ